MEHSDKDSKDLLSQEVLEILERQKVIYQELLLIERGKRQTILMRQAKELENINVKEEKLLEEVSALEKRRENLLLHRKVSEIETAEENLLQKVSHFENATQEIFNAPSVSLSALLKTNFFNASQKEHVGRLKTDIGDLLQKVKKESNSNQILLKETQDMFHTIMNMLSNDDNGTYSQDGHQENSKSNKALVLDLNC